MVAGVALCIGAQTGNADAFGSDAFARAKELAMVLGVFAAATVAVARSARVRADVVDGLLGLHVACAVASALFAASPWLAARGLALVAASAGAFWVGRWLAGRGAGPGLIRGIAAMVTLAAAVGLLEAAGLVDLSTPGRSPGGLAGNRNYLAHLVVLGAPLVGLSALTARTRFARIGWSCSLALISAIVMISRCRAAWLAAMVISVVALLLWYRSRPRNTRPALAVAACLIIGGVAAVAVPNDVTWRSSSPYRDTAARLFDAGTGSGRGRIIEYRTAMDIVTSAPVTGVGPGNWSVAYPALARPDDPNVRPAAVPPTKRLPTSDWLGIAAERGLLGLTTLAAFAFAIVIHVLRKRREPSGNAVLVLISGAVVLGLFDAVLLRPEPAFIVFAALGALVPARPGGGRVITRRWLAPLAVAGVLFALDGAAQTAAIASVRTSNQIADLERAVTIYPVDYRLQAMLAMRYFSSQDCERALRHSRRARALYPHLPRLEWSVERLCPLGQPSRAIVTRSPRS